MNRRQFTQTSLLAAAAAGLPSFAQSSSEKPLGFAPVGLGTISTIFMRALSNSQKAKVTGLVTGHPEEKGTKFGAMYNVPKSAIYTYETFDRIRDDKEIDAVYIGLPNSMHCEYTVRAAEAGKHVFCEKPMAISSAECRRMIDACRKAGVKLGIGYRVQHDPTWQHARELARSGAIGELRSFQGAFLANMPAGWRLHRALAGGGPPMDLGIYPLNAIRWITGEEPEAFTAVVSTMEKGPRFAEMEESMEWTMKFPSGIISSCSCSYGQSQPSYLNINGTKGWLRMSHAYSYDGLHLEGHANGEDIHDDPTAKSPVQFQIEAEAFVDSVRSGRAPLTPGEEGLKDMLAIEAIYRAAGRPIA